MTTFARYFHPSATVTYAPLAKLAPDIQIVLADEGEPPAEPLMALAFMTPTEAHLYPLSAGVREEIVTMLTGGVVVARTLPLPTQLNGGGT